MRNISAKMKQTPDSPSQIPSYLQHNSWEQELNFKLWVTKGARFCADKRLKAEYHLSRLSLNFLSAYLIVIGILPVFLTALDFSPSIIYVSLVTTTVSVILLAFGLIESSKCHELRAYHFHACGIKIARLYDRLRQAKEIGDSDTKRRELAEITREYEFVLDSYENHDPLDYDSFKIQKPDYFELSPKDIRLIKRKYYRNVKLVYHFILFAPPFVVFFIVFISHII